MAFAQQSGSSTEARVPRGKFTAKTESKELSKANGDRLEFGASNEGSKDAWLALGGEKAVAKEGPYLKAGGGAYTTTSYSGNVHVITAEGESNICIWEI
jgi:hypothetical protein